MQSRAYTYTRVRTLIYKTKSPPRGARRHHPNYTLDFAKRIASHQQAPPTVLSPVYALRRPVSMTVTYSDVCRNSVHALAKRSRSHGKTQTSYPQCMLANRGWQHSTSEAAITYLDVRNRKHPLTDSSVEAQHLQNSHSQSISPSARP